MKPDFSACEVKASAEQRQRPSQKIEAAGHLRVAGGAADMQVSSEFRKHAATAHENAVGRGDRQRERRIDERRARAGSFGLGYQREQRLRRRGRMKMSRAGNGRG